MQTRRQFLRAAVGGPLLLSLAPTVPLFLSRSAARAATLPAPDDRVLVVIQLTGGNDGLNTVVPFEDDAYARSRPTLRLKGSDVRKISPQLGLHPRMGSFERLFKEGSLAILQGVGCAGLSRDHESALRAWHTAEPDAPGAGTGWLGLATDHLWQKVRPAAPGVFVGNIPRPLGINAASAVVPTLRQVGDAAPDVASPSSGRLAPLEAGAEPDAPPSSALLGHVRASLAMAQAHARRLQEAGRTSPTKGYPACALGHDLQTVARLIRAQTGIRIFYAELGGGGIGGFDNHANQLGNHCALLEQLSDSVAAFVADLEAGRLLDRVLLMTFSEFGRTVAENGRRGTDHGAAGPMFLAGGKVLAGIHGPHPSLTDLDGGALKPSTDFRAVYAAVLEDWLGLPSAAILGGRFDRPTFLSST
jgi:uncharacterized protein (DUF1501 family)